MEGLADRWPNPHLGVELDVLVLLLSDDDGMLHRKEDIPSH